MHDNWFENYKDAIEASKEANETGYLIDRWFNANDYKYLTSLKAWDDEEAYQEIINNKDDKVYYVVGYDGSIGYIIDDKIGASWILTPPESAEGWSAVCDLLKGEIETQNQTIKETKEMLDKAISEVCQLHRELYSDPALVHDYDAMKDFYNRLCEIFNNKEYKVKEYYSKFYDNYELIKD